MMNLQSARGGINETNFPAQRLLIPKVINSQQRAMIFHYDDRMKCIIFYLKRCERESELTILRE